ncbi:MAG: hypothetical protein NC820_07300 [Candidatus Omnitrophica bacterium]|nr:hypothetical protein [Candidatus Omnitrophota bacterium]
MTMRICFKEKIIDLKIKVYADTISVIGEIRNLLVRYPGSGQALNIFEDELDKLYSKRQELLADIYLVSENEDIPKGLDSLLGFLYRTDRGKFIDEKSDELWNNIKSRAIKIVNLMRSDI